MSDPSTHILSWWPIALAAASGIIAIAIVIRYKIPELSKKLEAMEAKNSSKADLKKTVDNINTVCRFNQVTCHKEWDSKVSKINKELDTKLSDLYDLVNAQAVLTARVDERIQALSDQFSKAQTLHDQLQALHDQIVKASSDSTPPCGNAKLCLFNPQGAMVKQL